MHGDTGTATTASDPTPDRRGERHRARLECGVASPDSYGMNELTVSGPPNAGRSLKPNRVAIWPVEGAGFGIDFTYHGATGYTDAETAERELQAAGLITSFRQELDGAWTVRFGPLPRDHMRAVLDHFAW